MFHSIFWHLKLTLMQEKFRMANNGYVNESAGFPDGHTLLIKSRYNLNIKIVEFYFYHRTCISRVEFYFYHRTCISRYLLLVVCYNTPLHIHVLPWKNNRAFNYRQPVRRDRERSVQEGTEERRSKSALLLMVAVATAGRCSDQIENCRRLNGSARKSNAYPSGSMEVCIGIAFWPQAEHQP